ncbi:MFS transporter [Gulosibacter molinativorax]|uniref:MFS transporter n=1 Tax=Gulosibacter molinativorax TaxID=256821 RepID=A0ABT7C4N9_9MICO|nr:MFS transporter [Gulosibacter molinativorax]MDJ1370161.1 MFS transporter [Gulosibacter molinativorax]QUY61572.1 D-galactonate transporter [Gulosibacter molinativorax]
MTNAIPTTESLSLVPKRLPGIIFTVVLIAYIISVTQRSSLGVAGVAAAERFDSSATALSTLAVVQVGVYALMQIPVGMLLDRFGATRLILIGAALMAAAQALLAFAPTLEWAVLARVLVGIGDATTFVSGLRVIGAWFRPRKVPVMQQMFASAGQLGQFLSSIPFAVLLGWAGWTSSFLSLSGLSLIVAIAIAIFVKDSPRRRFESRPVSLRGAFVKLGEAFARPGTRLAFWTHFTTQFAATIFALLWGYPLMVEGLGYSPTLASSLLLVPVIAGMVTGPIMGVVTGRYPMRRSDIVITVSVLIAIAWIITILWPGEPPLWYFIIVLVLMGLGSTASTIAFDLARTFNPASSYGSASGIVNVGGFSASAISFLLVGIGVDWGTHLAGGTRDWSAFQLAYWAVPIVIAVGVIGLLVERHKSRSRMENEEGVRVDSLPHAIRRQMRRKN